MPTLRALAAAADLRPLAVFTQPAARRSRRGEPESSPVALAARDLGLETHEVESVNEGAALARLTELAPEAIVVVAFGQMLKKAVLNLPVHGCVNLHPSMLPLYRGAAPVQRAVMDGVTESGISVMRLVKKMDAGPILKQEAWQLDPELDAEQLLAQAGQAGARLLPQVLRQIPQLQAIAQDESRVTFAPPLEKHEGALDFGHDARRLRNRVRATQPWPRAWCFHGSKRIIVHRAALAPGSGTPGTVLAIEKAGIAVACAVGAVLFQTIQLEGKPAMGAFEVANGLRLKVGDVLTGGAPLAPGA